jgi:DNA polymerase bacteriophage-type
VVRPRATVDFESRSACDLRKCGAWVYSRHPSTEILCLAFRLPYWAKGRTGLWAPGLASSVADQRELCDWITSGRQVEAHNAFFERCLWANVLVPRFSFPPLGDRQIRDSAAKAASHALPRGLDAALEALGLSERKDVAGGKVMMKMNKPRKPRKKERESGVTGLLWHDTPELRETLYAYCRQDVIAEAALSAALNDLSPYETSIYLLDQRINGRGFQIDSKAVSTALALIGSEQSRCNAELVKLTGGSPDKATKRALMLKWFQANGLPQMPDTRKETVDGYLASDTIPTKARQGLVLLRTLGRSSTAKYEAMAHWADPDDGRARGGLVYHGASTGRWTGAGIQPQNFPKGRLTGTMEQTWRELMGVGYVSDARLPGGRCDNMEVLSYAVRGAITATPGHVLYVADYAAIEARVLLWLAGDEHALDTFRKGRDIYSEMATAIYGYPCEKSTHPSERALGKVAILGLGYQMGASKFLDTAFVMGGIVIDDEMAQQVVDAYRAKFWRVKEMWYATEAAAIEAVSSTKEVVNGYTTWIKEGRFLYCVLPSGRRLAYPDPQIKPNMTPWGEMRTQLTFMGTHPLSHKWVRQHTYGGSLVENITQAVSRDLMAAALLRIEHSDTYVPVLSVHDEAIAEARVGTGSVEEFEALMAALPDWAENCPVQAEGWTGLRYHK